MIGLLGMQLACTATAPKVSEEKSKAASTQVQLARGYMEKGKLEIALGRINRALELDSGLVEAHTVAAVIKQRIGRNDEAADHFRRAVELEPDNGDLLNNYGTILHKLGRYDDAISHFERALEKPFYRTPAAALSNAGASAEKQGRSDLAETYYRRALERDTNYPDALFRLSRIMLNADQPLKARAFLQRLEVRTQAVPEMLLLGYQIECAMGDTDTAQTYARNLRNRFPDSEQSRALKETSDGELCKPNDSVQAAAM